MFALVRYRAGLCPLCGMPVSVCTSHEASGPEFVPEFTVCRATRARLERIAAMDPDKNKYINARLWSTAIRKR
jgi:hypothetical protein